MEYRVIDIGGIEPHEVERILNEFAKGGWQPIVVIHDTLVLGRRISK